MCSNLSIWEEWEWKKDTDRPETIDEYGGVNKFESCLRYPPSRASIAQISSSSIESGNKFLNLGHITNIQHTGLLLCSSRTFGDVTCAVSGSESE